jgi:hypothetical protein
MPGSPAFGGGIKETILHPLVLVLMLLCAGLILVLPRRHMIIPLLASMFLIPISQQLYALGVHWPVCRVIVLVGLVRVLMIKVQSDKPLFVGGFNSIDRAFAACIVCQAVAVVLLFRESMAFINQAGFLIDFLGCYFVLRATIQNEKDLFRAVKCLAVVVAILAAVMIREQYTQQNLFGLLGGIPLFSEIRDGKIRSRAAFQHPLTAGAFGATLLPLFILLWQRGKAKTMAAVGVLSSTAMTLCANSSTPLLAYTAGLFAIAMWPLRRRMRTVRWSIVIALIVLHLCMKAPVWFLIARVDLTGSSSGFHRAELVDQFINHFRDWWLIGTKDTADWGEDIWDTQNEYVSVGETGGLLAFIFLIAMISRMYARIGNARKRCRSSRDEWYMWLLGAAVFSNCVAFIGVNYFDQSKVGWFLLIAMVSAATAPFLVKKKAPVDVPAEGPGVLSAEPELVPVSNLPGAEMPGLSEW